MKGGFKKRGEAYTKKDKTAQDKYGILRTSQLVFPNKKTIPVLARLALRILKRYDARVVDALVDKEGSKKGNK